MSDVPGFNPLQEVSLIEADFEDAKGAMDYLASRLGLPEQTERTPSTLREELIGLRRQSYVMISKADPSRDWFAPICDALEAASCENDLLVVMYAFTVV